MILVSCAGTKEQAPNEGALKATDMLGTWSNLDMAVRFPGDSVFNVPEGSWEEVLSIKPILTTYSADSTYTSDYYSLGDSLMFTSTGKWWVALDSLYLQDQSGITAYGVTLSGNTGLFIGYLDWDSDGEKNDLYSGRQLKVRGGNRP